MSAPFAASAPLEAPSPARSSRSGSDPTILMCVPYAINVRDVLRSGIFDGLQRAGARLVIVSPAHDDPAFRSEFARDGVDFAPLLRHRPSVLEQRFDLMRFNLFEDLTNTLRLKTRPKYERSLFKRAAVRTALAGRRIVGKEVTSAIYRRLNVRLFPDRYYADLFRRYRPNLVCLSRVFQADDQQVLKRAVMAGVRSVLLVASWDNLTSKGIFPAPIDRLVVWNEGMADEARDVHGFPADRIFVGGVPQFDAYADKTRLPTREQLFARISADPSKALLTVGAGSIRSSPHEFEVVELLYAALRRGELTRPAQILVRVHPLSNTEIPPQLRGLPDLLFDFPGRASAFIDRDASLDDVRHLAATMWHSDVLLNTASTTSIDAAYFDTPVVAAGFDGRQTLPYAESVRRYHDYTHFAKLLRTGGVRAVYDPKAMIDAINGYLLNPELDREGRRRIVAEQCGPNPYQGRAGERIAAHLLRLANERADLRAVSSVRG
jgi:CDP-glycerol glycerophosphotransferase (TagB/SpsB family)